MVPKPSAFCLGLYAFLSLSLIILIARVRTVTVILPVREMGASPSIIIICSMDDGDNVKAGLYPEAEKLAVSALLSVKCPRN